MSTFKTYFMKAFISILAFFASISSAYSDQITATIVFENSTEKTSISGVFYITETNQSFEVNSLENFTVELPKEGKYQFRFYSEDAHALTSYPVRITERKNTITIRLENKTEEISFEKAIIRLEEIVSEMESGTTDLDAMVKPLGYSLGGVVLIFFSPVQRIS